MLSLISFSRTSFSFKSSDSNHAALGQRNVNQVEMNRQKRIIFVRRYQWYYQWFYHGYIYFLLIYWTSSEGTCQILLSGFFPLRGYPSPRTPLAEYLLLKKKLSGIGGYPPTVDKKGGVGATTLSHLSSRYCWLWFVHRIEPFSNLKSCNYLYS